MTWEQEQELEWVLAAQAGDFSSYDHLARRYRPGLVALVGKRLCRDAAEDIAQEALLVAFKALPGLQSPDRFRPWLGAIAKNLAGRHYGRTARHTTLDSVILSYAPSIVEDLHLSIRSRQIREAINGFSHELRSVVDLYYVHDWSVSDIAEFLAIPATTVKWRLHTGRTQLRQRFGDLLED